MKEIIKNIHPVMTPVASGTFSPVVLFKSTSNRLALINISLNLGIIW